jgi:7,8-dihydropterin-6-yl-methyl-4-(beta-D-ribofuranosyl)aminobenzene 5'-phosphate synthase
VKIGVVFDNKGEPGFKTGWGFSSFVDYKEKILFDVGYNADILNYNLQKMGYKIRDFDALFLSHEHLDHIGSLFEILKNNADLNVFVSNSFSQSLKEEIKKRAKLFEIKEAKEIFENVYTTGAIKNDPDEQALIIKTEKGPILITGCAHPGIVKIIKKAKEIIKEDIFLVLGGFHLFEAEDSEIEKIIEDFKNLGVKKVAPCHCTGERATNLFKKEYKNNFIEMKAGKLIQV